MTKRKSILIFQVIFMAAILAFAYFPQLARAYADADADQGKQLFEKRCTGCHSLDQNKEGPRLRGVYGRQAGKTPGYTYSAALQSSQLIWDDASLDKWLTDPDSLIPDNNMAFHVPRLDERAEVIRYLKALSSK